MERGDIGNARVGATTVRVLPTNRGRGESIHNVLGVSGHKVGTL